MTKVTSAHRIIMDKNSYTDPDRISEWYDKRWKRLTMDKFQCQDCHHRRASVVYHKTKNFANENIETDLTSLCLHCYRERILIRLPKICKKAARKENKITSKMHEMYCQYLYCETALYHYYGAVQITSFEPKMTCKPGKHYPVFEAQVEFLLNGNECFASFTLTECRIFHSNYWKAKQGHPGKAVEKFLIDPVNCKTSRYMDDYGHARFADNIRGEKFIANFKEKYGREPVDADMDAIYCYEEFIIGKADIAKEHIKP